MFGALSRRPLSLPAAVCVGLVFAWCGAACGANPNTREPMLPLEIHNTAGAQPTLQLADGLFQALLKDVQAIGANPTRVAGKKLYEMQIQLRQLRRAVADLEMLGETAGFDYGLRAAVVGGSLGRIMLAFGSTPAGQAYVNQAHQFLSSPKSVQARRVAVQKVQQLLQQEELEQAFKVFHDASDPVAALISFMDPHSAESYTREFIPVAAPVNDRRNAAFFANALATMDKASASLAPQTQELLAAVAAAATALRSAPQATVDDRSLTGPQCVEHFGGVWRRLHLSAVRCFGVEWARVAGVPELSNLQQPQLEQARFPTDAMVQFNEQIGKALASLIEADTQRITDAEAPDLYVQYLQTLAPLVLDTANGKLEQAVEPALTALAAKSVALAAEVSAYRTATHELLRWRERLARSQAEAAAAEFQPSEQALVESFVGEGDFHGLYIPTNPMVDRAILGDACPQVIPVAAKRALEKKILVVDLAGLGNGKFAVARYRHRHYATLPVPDETLPQTQLSHELLVTEQHPPLTLEACAAMDSMRRGYFAAVGGTITGFHLEGVIPRFAGLRPEAQQLIPLDALPADGPSSGLIAHIVVRFELRPAWLRHRYFFVPVPAAPSS